MYASASSSVSNSCSLCGLGPLNFSERGGINNIFVVLPRLRRERLRRAELVVHKPYIRILEVALKDGLFVVLEGLRVLAVGLERLLDSSGVGGERSGLLVLIIISRYKFSVLHGLLLNFSLHKFHGVVSRKPVGGSEEAPLLRNIFVEVFVFFHGRSSSEGLHAVVESVHCARH